MTDQSTNVFTRSSQVDETHLHLRPGMTTCINITIVYKAGGRPSLINLFQKVLANTFYVIAKFKGKEYHGILTDGEAPLTHTYLQKRNAANVDKNEHHGNEENNAENKSSSNTASVHKHRAGQGKRGGRTGGERRIRNGKEL